jgi:excisionase family DNA binding protein
VLLASSPPMDVSAVPVVGWFQGRRISEARVSATVSFDELLACSRSASAAPLGGDRLWEVSVVALDELPGFLTVEEAAAVLRIGRTCAYQLAQPWRATGGESGLPVLQFGRQLRVPRSALIRMAERAGYAT